MNTVKERVGLNSYHIYRLYGSIILSY